MQANPQLPLRRAAKIFRDDVVCVDATGETALVMRSWTDLEESMIPEHPRHEAEIKTLLEGEVDLVDLQRTKRTIQHVSGVSLMDRYFHLGDAVKRLDARSDDGMSGIVLEHSSELLLRHVISDAPLGNQVFVPADELEVANEINLGDLVIYNNWLGHVEEIFEEVEGELNGRPAILNDVGSRFRLGKPSPMAREDLPEGYVPDLILAIHPLVVCVAWLAVNQALGPQEAAACERPKQFFQALEINKLTFLRRSADRTPRVLDRVKFKTEELAQKYGAPSTQHAREPGVAPITVRAFNVVASRSRVKVLWQDGRIEEGLSVDLAPHHILDDLDCWPGDFVLWTGDGESREAIVQSLDAAERTATVKWVNPKEGELVSGVVSCLELDPRGKLENEDYHVFGVQRGDIVFIHPVGQTNGSPPPLVPKIGDMETWAYDPAQQRWREQMVQIGVSLSKIPIRSRPPGWDALDSTQAESSSARWVGEVVGLRSNGEIEILYPDASTEVVTVERLTILNDFLEELTGFEDGSGHGSEDDFAMFEDDAVDIPAVPMPGALYFNDPNNQAQGFAPVLSRQDSMEEDAWKHLDEPTSPTGTGASTPYSSHNMSRSPSSPHTPTSGRASPFASATSPTGDAPIAHPSWIPFLTLSEAPSDHAFLTTPPTQPVKAFLTRLRKEYKVLTSSLPSDILVRVYENRTDLLRCLIIGSENTPYQDAPFVIDWFLPPNFPNEPPKAHFHSWTNGNGRVNPYDFHHTCCPAVSLIPLHELSSNLYEDGKVCLSILNTWEGDTSESWSAARSSLLQALVSIQGLVLVREPYFCEPSFERLRGTEEGTLASRLYNERAYVMARGFVKHALDSPPSGLADELFWLYYTRGKLEKVVNDSKALIASSREAPQSRSQVDEARSWDGRAVGRLTMGGILPLQRTLGHLEAHLASHQ